MQDNSLSNINPLRELLFASVITEEQINTLADKLVEQILETSMGIDEMGLMTALNKLTKGIVDRLRGRIDLRDKDYKFKGISYSKSNTGTTLNYEDDEIYNRLVKAVDDRKEILKNAFANSDKEIIVKDGGEVIPIVSVKKANTEIIKLTFKKK